MSNLLAQIIWVAGYHGLRGRAIWERMHGTKPAPSALWEAVFDVGAILGNPTAPGGPK